MPTPRLPRQSKSQLPLLAAEPSRPVLAVLAGRRLPVAALLARLAQTAVAAAVRLDVGDGKVAPKEFRIFGYGRVETSKGTFLFDDAAAKLVMAAYTDQGNELCFDYEHGMADDAEGKPRPAACWFKLELRDDGLWATDCKWTPAAAKMLSEGEYRYFSPYMEFDGESGRILRLLNLALTNIPATKGMTPLVAASQRPARDHRTARAALSLDLTFEQVRDALQRALRTLFPDSYAYLADIYDDSCVFETGGRLYQIAYAITEGNRVTFGDEAIEVLRTYTPVVPGDSPVPDDEEGATMKTLLATLGLKDTATEAEAVAALNALFAAAKEHRTEIEALKAQIAGGEREITTLTGTKDRPEALVKVAALKKGLEEAQAQNTVLGAKLAEVEIARLHAEVDQLVDEGMREAKISPAQKEFWTETGRASLSVLKKHLATAPKLVATPALAQPTTPPGQAPDVSVAELAYAKEMGISAEAIAKYKAERGPAAASGNYARTHNALSEADKARIDNG